jgi:uncharacterized membrane protein
MNHEPNHGPDVLARAVQVTLLMGLIPSGLLMVSGLFIALISGQPRPDTSPPGIGTLVQTALRFDGVALLSLGVVLLMLTPLLRVVVLAAGWSLRRDWRFALVALSVLSLLAISLTLGFG